MNTHILKAAAVLPAILAFTSCSTEHPGDFSSVAAIQHGTPGGVVRETYTEIATVTAIDHSTRHITLATRDGHKETITAGPEVVNFGKIAVGDHVKTTIADQAVVYVSKPGEPVPDSVTTDVYRARKGARPQAGAAETTKVTAKVTAIDLKRHKATLQFRDGTSKAFKVRDDVDLTKHHVGDEVTILLTSAVAISVEKP